MILAAASTSPTPLWLTLLQYGAVAAATLIAAIITQGVTSRRERKRANAQRVADREDERVRREEDRKDEADRRRYESQERVANQSRDSAKECLEVITEALSEADALRLPVTASPGERAERGHVDWEGLSTHVRRAGVLIDAKIVREVVGRGASGVGIYARSPGWDSYAEALAKDLHGLLAAWLREDDDEQARRKGEIDAKVSKAIEILKARIHIATNET